MITKLKLRNFKSHLNSQIDLRQLTILTGINGCGKTSILQSLLLLRQTYQKGRLTEGLDLNKPLCDIGIANDALYQLATDGIISFEFENNGEPFVFSFNAGQSLKDSFIRKEKYSNNISKENLDNISLFNNNFQYVSAARWGGKGNYPKETYTVEMQHQLSLNNGQGELTGHFLFKFGSDTVYDYIKNDGQSTIALLEQVKYWEQAISPRVDMVVEQNSDKGGFNIFYGFNGVGDNKNITNLKAENIGYGISYSLPVVVALLSASPGALVIIENPEAHLHPEGQSVLAQLIALVAQRGIQVIVETHSDHIFNGIMVAVYQYHNKGVGIAANNVATYYIREKDAQHASVIEPVVITKQGVLVQQLDGFFDREEKDMMILNG